MGKNFDDTMSVPENCYLTIIPNRSPVRKIHTSLGHAKNALLYKQGDYSGSFYYDMAIYELRDGLWHLRYEVERGSSEVPW